MSTEETQPTLQRGEQLAADHWAYIERTLMTHGVPISSDVMRVSRFHYTQAFKHGYKHGCEDMLQCDYSDAPIDDRCMCSDFD
jgi:hypothetical protein